MSVKLRLMRMGKKKQPTYRIVAADSRSPRDGRFIEVVGTYAPRSEPSVVTVDNDKAVAWLAKGAQPTDTVRKLLEISGAWADFVATRPGSKAVATSPRRAAAAPVAASAAAAAPAVPAASTAAPAASTAAPATAPASTAAPAASTAAAAPATAPASTADAGAQGAGAGDASALDAEEAPDTATTAEPAASTDAAEQPAEA